MIVDLHHVQLAMSKGAEDEAHQFYCNVLGLAAVEKPQELQGRGGVWFQSGSVRIHLGVEEPFSPAKKAHPAFRVSSLLETKIFLEGANIPFEAGNDLPGIIRLYIHDPFGNRIELLETLATV